MRTLFVPFLQTQPTHQAMRAANAPLFSGKVGTKGDCGDRFERSSVPLFNEAVPNSAGPLLAQTWIPALSLDLPHTSVTTRVVTPNESLSSQGYQQVTWTHPKTQERFEIRRSNVNTDGTVAFSIRPLEKPDAKAVTKRLHMRDLPQMVVIDNFRPAHDLDGDGRDCVSHGDMVLQVARRVNPFGVYHVIQPEQSIGFSTDLMQGDRPVVDALVRQASPAIRSINFSYGQTVPMAMLGFFVGQDISLDTLPDHAPVLKDLMAQAYRMDYLPFKQAHFESFARHSRQYAKTYEMNPADFTDRQIGYDFMFIYERLREAHLDHKQFKRLKEKGIQPYVSAGNSGGSSISLSALSPDVILVGGLDAQGDPAEFSSLVLPHHPSVRAEFPVKSSPKGINFTDTPDVVDIPVEQLPVTATLMQVGHLLGLPVKDRVFDDAEVKEMLTRHGRRYASRHMQSVKSAKNPMRPPLSREDLMKALNTKLLTHPQLGLVTRSLGLSQVGLNPIGKYVAMAQDGSLLQVNETPEGLTIPALTRPMETLRGTSFSSPAVMAQRELDNFVLNHFQHALAA